MEFSSGTRLSNPLRTRSLVRALRQLCLALPILILTGCAGGHALVPRDVPAPAGSAVSWLTPEFASDAAVLSRWRAGVGSPLVIDAATTAPVSDALTVVSWNIALGAGDVVPLVRELQSSGHGAIVLLIQEAYRSGDDIPKTADCAFAGFLGNSKPDREIDAVAQALGFSLYYAPSMRNGAPGRHNEDRGNAILTNLDLDDLVAIELPFERQRRVAVAATVRGLTSGGAPWSETQRNAPSYLRRRYSISKDGESASRRQMLSRRRRISGRSSPWHRASHHSKLASDSLSL